MFEGNNVLFELKATGFSFCRG